MSFLHQNCIEIRARQPLIAEVDSNCKTLAFAAIQIVHGLFFGAHIIILRRGLNKRRKHEIVFPSVSEITEMFDYLMIPTIVPSTVLLCSIDQDNSSSWQPGSIFTSRMK